MTTQQWAFYGNERRRGPGPASVAAGGGSEASAFLARTSGLDTTHTNAFTTLINGLVSAGIWSKLDALWWLGTNSTRAIIARVESFLRTRKCRKAHGVRQSTKT